MDDKLKDLLIDASNEIKQLRRTNEVLAAKVEMIDLFACVLHTKPATHEIGMAPDIVWAIDKYTREHA